MNGNFGFSDKKFFRLFGHIIFFLFLDLTNFWVFIDKIFLYLNCFWFFDLKKCFLSYEGTSQVRTRKRYKKIFVVYHKAIINHKKLKKNGATSRNTDSKIFKKSNYLNIPLKKCSNHILTSNLQNTPLLMKGNLWEIISFGLNLFYFQWIFIWPFPGNINQVIIICLFVSTTTTKG